ncbi:MAG TPA: ATP-binding cassette domain-containing protein, partial [Henriciella sp.]|nr:ATP-binding cassette domain-containing protein [Henriciella sp.]
MPAGNQCGCIGACAFLRVCSGLAEVEIPREQICAIIGPSGSGKSTLAFNV